MFRVFPRSPQYRLGDSHEFYLSTRIFNGLGTSKSHGNKPCEATRFYWECNRKLLECITRELCSPVLFFRPLQVHHAPTELASAVGRKRRLNSRRIPDEWAPVVQIVIEQEGQRVGLRKRKMPLISCLGIQVQRKRRSCHVSEVRPCVASHRDCTFMATKNFYILLWKVAQ